jgi:DNA processing protein
MNEHPIIRIEKDSYQYPKLLDEIKRAPKQIFAKGNLELLHSTCLSIVGTRANTIEGKANTLHFTRGLVSYGLTIVSGLAFGIDAIAHEVTLDCGGKTIAVLGNGIDHIQPRYHEGLARRILKNGGLIISEYGPGQPSHKHHFPARNRIISGVSIGTLIIEAPKKSGALITARRAFEQNRDVFVVPGALSNSKMKGNLNLLSSDSARLVQTPEDIITHLSHQPELLLKPMVKKEITPVFETRAQKNVWRLLSKSPKSMNDLIMESDLSFSEVAVAVTYFEIKECIRNIGYGQFIKVI